MKKIIALLLVAVMLLSLVACASKPAGADADKDADNDVPPTEANSPADGDTIGQTLLADFKENINANPDITAQELADAIIANEIIEFAPVTEPVETGYLNGFDNEINGFSEGVVFCPMIGSIAFVGYIFQLDDGADVDAFMQTLKDNANLRWNVCVEADEMIVEHEGNTVFFLMCQNNIEE